MNQNFYDFLKSDKRIETFESDNDGKIIVSKVKCNDKIEILYALEDCSEKLFDLNSSFKYIGIYNKENNKLYDINFFIFRYYLNMDFFDEEIITKRNLFKIIKEEVNEKITNIVNSNKEKILDFYKSVPDIVIEEDDVLCYFIKGITSESIEDSYNKYYTDDPEKIISYLTDKNTFLEKEAKDYILNHVDSIVSDIYKNKKKREILKEIEDNKEHPYYKIKEIVNILRDKNFVTVNLTINKNGIEQTFKYNADILKKYYNSTFLPGYGIEKKSERDLFEEIYGKWVDFDYKDIKKITYGKKVIYEDENLKENEMEMEMEL